MPDTGIALIWAHCTALLRSQYTFYLDYAGHAFASILQKKKKRKESILHACFSIKDSCLFVFGLGSFFHRGVGRAELMSLV